MGMMEQAQQEMPQDPMQDAPMAQDDTLPEGAPDQEMVAQLHQIASNIVWDKAFMGRIVEEIDGGMDISEGISMGLLMAITRADQETGGQMPYQVLLQVAVMLLGEMGDWMERTGRIIDENDLMAAFQLAVGTWLQQNPDRVPPEEMAQLQQQLDGAQQEMQPQQEMQQPGMQPQQPAPMMGGV